MTYTRPGERPAGAPKRKSLEFEKFRFIFDYVSNHLYVEELLPEDQRDKAPRQIRFTKAELSELTAALKSFGMETPDPNAVTCR